MTTPIIPGSIVALGYDSDSDSAFDLASDDQAFAAATSEAGVPKIMTEVPLSLDLATLEARLDSEPGIILARPFLSPSRYSRRKVVIKLDDPDLDLPPYLTPDFIEYLTPHLDLQPEEHIEAFELRSVRARYRPEAASFTGKPMRTFVLLNPATNTLIYGPEPFLTATAARKYAKDLAKEPFNDTEVYSLEVVGIQRRDSGEPFARVDRRRVAQKLTLKVTLATHKDSGKDKIAGWMFYLA